jgi:hypothetical protein
MARGVVQSRFPKRNMSSRPRWASARSVHTVSLAWGNRRQTSARVIGSSSSGASPRVRAESRSLMPLLLPRRTVALSSPRSLLHASTTSRNMSGTAFPVSSYRQIRRKVAYLRAGIVKALRAIHDKVGAPPVSSQRATPVQGASTLSSRRARQVCRATNCAALRNSLSISDVIYGRDLSLWHFGAPESGLTLLRNGRGCAILEWRPSLLTVLR